MTDNTYTCREYRQEMILLSLKKRLAAADISEEEKKYLQQQIAEVEQSMGME